MSTTTEKPRRLILTPREVRALLAGATQVRRMLYPQPVERRGERVYRDDPPTVWAPGFRAPLVAGQRYYGAEAYHACPHCEVVAYRAGGWMRGDDRNNTDDRMLMPKCRAHGWRSAATMPRWASRLSLLVESVRVERVREATEEDARAMGVRCPCGKDGGDHAHRENMAKLWDAERPRAPWAANPWVAVGTVRRIEG